MIIWFDIGYATLNIIAIFYCFKEYLSSRKKLFQLLSLGFTGLIISDFVWMFAIFFPVEYLSYIATYVSTIRSLYTPILRALQLSSPQTGVD